MNDHVAGFVHCSVAQLQPYRVVRRRAWLLLGILRALQEDLCAALKCEAKGRPRDPALHVKLYSVFVVALPANGTRANHLGMEEAAGSGAHGAREGRRSVCDSPRETGKHDDGRSVQGHAEAFRVWVVKLLNTDRATL